MYPPKYLTSAHRPSSRSEPSSRQRASPSDSSARREGAVAAARASERSQALPFHTRDGLTDLGGLRFPLRVRGGRAGNMRWESTLPFQNTSSENTDGYKKGKKKDHFFIYLFILSGKGEGGGSAHLSLF